jgi:hypothetical protein
MVDDTLDADQIWMNPEDIKKKKEELKKMKEMENHELRVMEVEYGDIQCLSHLVNGRMKEVIVNKVVVQGDLKKGDRIAGVMNFTL